MDYSELKRTARRIGSDLVAIDAENRRRSVGIEQIEQACDAAIEDLSPDDRETLIGLTCRRVVELSLLPAADLPVVSRQPDKA